MRERKRETEVLRMRMSVFLWTVEKEAGFRGKKPFVWFVFKGESPPTLKD